MASVHYQISVEDDISNATEAEDETFEGTQVEAFRRAAKVCRGLRVAITRVDVNDDGTFTFTRMGHYGVAAVDIPKFTEEGYKFR